MRQFLRVTLVRTKRTDLMCIRCGGFRTEFAVVAPGETDQTAHVGVHRRDCSTEMHAARRMNERAKPQSAAEVPS